MEQRLLDHLHRRLCRRMLTIAALLALACFGLLHAVDLEAAAVAEQTRARAERAERKRAGAERLDLEARQGRGEAEVRMRIGFFQRAAREFGLPPTLLEAVTDQESMRNPWAVNVGGRSHFPATKEAALGIIAGYATRSRSASYDLGLMQINSYWVRTFGLDPAGVLDPEANIRLGAWILRRCIDRYGAGWRALAAYHMGNPHRDEKTARTYAFQVLRRHYELRRARLALAGLPESVKK